MTSWLRVFVKGKHGGSMFKTSSSSSNTITTKTVAILTTTGKTKIKDMTIMMGLVMKIEAWIELWNPLARHERYPTTQAMALVAKGAPVLPLTHGPKPLQNTPLEKLGKTQGRMGEVGVL